jgi:hypothetical protein
VSDLLKRFSDNWWTLERAPKDKENEPNLTFLADFVRPELSVFNYARYIFLKEKEFDNVKMGIESVSLIQF